MRVPHGLIRKLFCIIFSHHLVKWIGFCIRRMARSLQDAYFVPNMKKKETGEEFLIPRLCRLRFRLLQKGLNLGFRDRPSLDRSLQFCGEALFPVCRIDGVNPVNSVQGRQGILFAVCLDVLFDRFVGFHLDRSAVFRFDIDHLHCNSPFIFVIRFWTLHGQPIDRSPRTEAIETAIRFTAINTTNISIFLSFPFFFIWCISRATNTVFRKYF